MTPSREEGPSGVHADLWAPDGPSPSPYREPPLSEETLRSVEAELGVRLPAVYVGLAGTHNGGLLRRNVHPSPTPTTWATDHVALTGLFAIGRTASGSLCGALGQRLWLEEWGYPALGVYVADTPSAGHDMIALDYRACGPDGEPSVVHVDHELDCRVTPLAPTFADFLAGLVTDDAFGGRSDSGR